MLLLGCEKNYQEAEIDSPIVVQMVPDYNNPSKNIELICKTEKIYPCCNFTLKSKVSNRFKNISIEFKYVIIPDMCLTTFGPAVTTIKLGNLSKGAHKFKTIVNDVISEGELIVTDEKYVLKIENPKEIVIAKETLNKIPKNTIWGTIGYHEKASESMVNTFLDSLQILGATPSKYLPGDYHAFYIQENGEILNEPALEYWFSKRFIFDFSNNIKSIEELLTRYKENYWDKLRIAIYTSDGDYFTN